MSEFAKTFHRTSTERFTPAEPSEMNREVRINSHGELVRYSSRNHKRKTTAASDVKSQVSEKVKDFQKHEAVQGT